MRILAAIAGLVVSSYSFGGTMAIDKISYAFEGSWSTSGGETGTWANQTDLDQVGQNPSTISLVQNLTLQTANGPVAIKLEWLLVETENQKYDVKVKNETVGSGFCGDSDCHFKVVDATGETEVDWLFKNGLVYESGSKKTSDGTEIWKGVGRPINQ